MECKIKKFICNKLCAGKNTEKSKEQSNNFAFISFDDFTKVKIRVGKVLEAKAVEGSDKLIKTIIDFGDEKRVVVSGIRKYRNPEELVGKKFLYVVNLEPRKIFGIESQAMVLAASDDNDFALTTIDSDVKEGTYLS